MLQKVKEYFEVFLLFFLTSILVFFFLASVPISKDPYGLLIMNELSDFSNKSLINWAFFGSASICVVLGSILMNWVSFLTPGIISSLLSMTYFLLWVDCVFDLSIQFQTFDFLKCFGIGLCFISLFFFVLDYVNSRNIKPKEAGGKEKLIQYWLIGWICFYFWISIALVFKSFKYFESQLALSIGFFGICFLNYLLLLFLKKQQGNEIKIFSKMGRYIFVCWFLIIVLMEIGQAWLR